MTLTQPSSSPLPLSFDPQHKRTASCGLLTARATRPHLCRVVSAAFLIRWSCLAGEHRTDALDQTWSGPQRLPHSITRVVLFISRHNGAFNTKSQHSCDMFLNMLRHPETVQTSSQPLHCGWCAFFVPVCLQHSLPAISARGRRHENVWSHGGGTH